MFGSLSAISDADSFSEVSFQMDHFMQQLGNPNSMQTGPNAILKRYSSIEGSPNNKTAETGATFNVAFILTPLDEFDDEFDNPLNQGMMKDNPAAIDFTWSKRREEDQTNLPAAFLIELPDTMPYQKSILDQLNITGRLNDELNHSF